MTKIRPVFAAAVVALLVSALAGCGSSGGSEGASSSKTTTTASPSTTAASGTTEAATKVIQVLVSNDDGYAADGIDVLVQALRKEPDLKITVVAPKDQRSGTGSSTKDGKLAVTDVKLKSGYPAKAVDGFPADTIRVAVDEMGIEPDVAITGINFGQNVGPLVDVSGTVGAARAAVARGIPALATSGGNGNPVDYQAAVPFILAWLKEHRAALSTGDLPAKVENLNVPTCTKGKVRGLAEVPADLKGDAGKALANPDCTSTTPKAQLTSDIDAFAAGFATLDVVPTKPGGTS